MNIFTRSKRLKLLFEHFNLVNHGCPSHFWPNAEPSLIDLVFTKSIYKVKCFFHYNLIPSTHHDLLFVSYKTKYMNNNRPSKFSFRDYNKISTDDLISSLKSIDLCNIYNVADINDKINLFNDHYFELFNKHVPITNVKLKSCSKPWFKIRKDKYISYKTIPNNNLDEKKSQYLEYRKYCSIIKNKIKWLKRINF